MQINNFEHKLSNHSGLNTLLFTADFPLEAAEPLQLCHRLLSMILNGLSSLHGDKLVPSDASGDQLNI